MAYLTENRLSDIVDIPIALAATELMMGDWIVIASIKVQTGMRVACSLLTLQVNSCSVPIVNITPANFIYGNLGLIYVVLRKDYTSGNPGAAGGLDSVVATNLGLFTRDITAPVIVTQPGTYSWVIANNMQYSEDNPGVPAGTDVNFVATVTGTARLELSHL
jgi:hypothetical protein